MAAKGRGIFPYMAIVKRCEHSRGHIYCPIFMKFGQNICLINILDGFENYYVCLKNMAAMGRGIFPYKNGYCKILLTLLRPHLFSDLHETWSEYSSQKIS